MKETGDVDILQQLKTTRLADILTDKELSEVALPCRPVVYPAGHQLVQQGEMMDKLLIVVKGCLRGVIGRGANQTDLGIRQFGRNCWAIWSAQRPAFGSGHSCEFESHLLTIDRDNVTRLCSIIPGLNQWLRQGFFRRFQGLLTEDKQRRFARLVVFVCPSHLAEFWAVTR